MAKTRFVVVGAGHSGGRAVEALRSAAPDPDILILGQEKYPPYERPPLSKAVLTGASDHARAFLKPAAYYADQRIDLRLSTTVTRIDRANQRVETATGGIERYDHLIVATGARPRTLSVPGADTPRVRYLRDVDDALGIRSELRPGTRVVVVGAGLIGLEVAASARGLGCAVTVLEAADQPMGRVLAPEIAAWFLARHRSAGVDLRCGVRISSIVSEAEAVRVVMRDALKDAEELVADLVVVGIGAIPNDELARAAGLAVEDGIVVDEFGRTSDPAISAAGDVTRHFNPVLGRHVRLESWQNAQNQGIAVARNVAGEAKPYAEVPWFWSDQYDVNLQMVGLPLAWDRLVYRGDPAGSCFTAFYLADSRVVAANAVNNPRDIRFARMLIQQAREVSPDTLSEPSVNLTELCRAPVPTS